MVGNMMLPSATYRVPYAAMPATGMPIIGAACEPAIPTSTAVISTAPLAEQQHKEGYEPVMQA